MSVLCGLLLFGIPAGGEKPPPLTKDQIKQLQSLVRGTQAKAKRIQNALQKKQEELAKLYADFDLDVAKVSRLQADVLDLQNKLLRNYHDMHVQLRSIVGRERFPMLQKRIDLIFGVGKKPKKT